MKGVVGRGLFKKVNPSDMKIYDRTTRAIKQPGPPTVHFATSGKIRFSVAAVQRLQLTHQHRVILLEKEDEWFVAFLRQQDPDYDRGLSLHQQGQSLHCHSRTISRAFLEHLQLRAGHTFPLATAATQLQLPQGNSPEIYTYAILTAQRLRELKDQALCATATSH